MKSKILKIVLLFNSFGLVLLLTAAVMAAAMFAAIAGGSSSASNRAGTYDSGIEGFDISGSYDKDKKASMKFEFADYEITGIKADLSGTSEKISIQVMVPKLSGTYEAITYQFFRQKGYTHEGTCGIMGCLWAESGFEPCAVEGENSWTSGKSNAARGYGIAQWTNTTPPYTKGRRTNIQNWLKEKGYDPYKSSQNLLEGQLNYIIIEKGYDDTRNFCKSTTDVAKSTARWLRGFEGAYTSSYYAKRVAKAKEYEVKYRNYKADGGAKKKVTLKAEFNIKTGKARFSGALDGVDIAGEFTMKDGHISGTGQYGAGASCNGADGVMTGVESKSTAAGRKITKSVSKWSNPYSQGYAHLCEGWVARVYSDAGLSYPGSCCAAKSRDKNARKSGKIPIGAVIYSGSKYKSSVICECGRNAGHVAIYIGHNTVAGSQMPYKQTLDDWISIFGYGGWYFVSN